jgi:hypothetical protein
MAFIRRKVNHSGTISYHVVRTFREGAKVRHQTLISLADSPTIADRLEVLREEADFYQEIKHIPILSRQCHKKALDVLSQIRKLKAIQKETSLP